LLGVTQAASEAEILRAWRKRMTNYHPDKAGSEAEDMAKLLNQAKSVLCDKTERMKYDERRDEATEDYESGADLPRLPTGKTLSKDLMSRIAAWRESSETAHGAQCDPNGFANKFFEETRQAVLDLQEKLRVIKRTRRSTLQSPVFIESIASGELSEEHLDDEVLTEACKWARETLEKTLKRNTQTKVPPVQEGELVCCYDLSSLKESELRKLMVILIPPSGSKPLSSDPEKMRQRLKDVLPKFRVDVNRERRGIKKFFLGARCVVCSAEKDLSERKCFLVAGACHEFRPVCLTCSKLESKKRLQLWEELAATPQTGFVASYVATGIASIERMMHNLKINQPKSVVEATFDSSIALTTKLFLAASALWLALQKSQRNEHDIESLQSRQTELVLEISEEKDPDQELRLLLLLVENEESALESNENFRSFLTQEEARLKLIVDSADLNNSIHIAFSQSPRDRLLLRQASKYLRTGTQRASVEEERDRYLQKTRKGQMTPLQAAMSALDLAMACETLAEVLACFLECVALLLRALEIEESLYQRFALKEAMFEIGIASVSICLNNFSDSALLNYVSRHAFALLRDAATKVGRPDDVERLISILEIVAFTGRFSPFVSLPLVRPSESLVFSNVLKKCAGCGNTYLSIDKVIFNKNTFQISVVGSKGNLVSDFDVLTGLLMDHPGVAFSLDKPANLHEARFHPFQKYWSSQPDLLKGTPLLDTLFNTDYIMKQFSSGLEICRKPPFDRRPLLNGRGLFAGLPDQLRWLLRPLSERGGQRSRCSRFWIAATDMEMKVEETPDTIEFVFGKVRLEVKTHRMVASMGGEHQDAETDDEDSPENQFAKDMTEALPSLGRFFPEFERLKELTKIPKLCLIIKAMHQSLGAMTVRQEQVEQILDHERAVRMEKSYEMAKNVLETLDRAESIPGASHYDCCNLATDQLLSQLNLNKTETVRALRRRDVRTLQYLLADSLPSSSAADVRQQIQDLIDSKRREFRNWNSKIQHKLNSSLHQRQQKISDCDWAPAVLSASSDATTRSTVYGGVLLNPKSVHSSFRMEFPPGSTVHKVVSFLILGELNSKQFASTRTFDSLDLGTVNELLGNNFPEMESSSDSELGGRSGRDNEGATSSADNQPRTSKNDQFLNDEGNWSHIFSDKPGHVVPRNAKEEWELRKKLVSIRDLALKKDPRCIDASQQFVHVEGRKNNCRFIFYKDERETSSDVLHLAWWIRIDGNGRIVGAGCNTVLAKERIPQLFLFLRPIPTGEALMAFFLREKHKLHGKKTDNLNIVSERANSERQYTAGARLSAAAIAAAVEEGPEGYVFVE
uniref:J domain-containing protein n=1 Tax=Macrostomum lignano TaxID=282301 RepID=A0A1I8GVL3_9PLAT